MRILYLCHRTPFPPNKGERIRTFHQIEYLRRLGHQLVVAAPVTDATDQRNLKALADGYCEQVLEAPAPGRLALLLALLKTEALSVSHFYSKALQHNIDRYLQQQAVDAIVCTSSSMAAYVFRSTAKVLQGPHRPALVMDFMDLDSDKWRQYAALKSFPMSLIYQREARLIARLEQRIHEHFDACLFISRAEVELFLRSNPDLGKLRVIANGIDTDAFKPAAGPKPEAGPLLLFTGVMDYLPNEDAMLWLVEGAWERIKQAHPGARLCIAGMNPSPRIQALQRYPGVEVTGFVEDIQPYYDQAHVFVAPFRLARGVQNKVLQAFACGLPTITTAMGCEGIDCEPGEQVLVADTLDDLIRHLQWVVDHPQQAQRLGHNATLLIREHFSWDSKLKDFEPLLHRPTVQEAH